MTIQELADTAGVTTRTIRYYVEQGILPPPERGRPAEYTGEHVRRLELIRRLKEQYLPLEEIRDMLQRLTPQEVERLAEQYTPRTEERAQGLSSAGDYIAEVLGRGQAREELKRSAPPAQPPASMPPPAPSAPPVVPPPAGRGRGWLRGRRPPFGRSDDGEKLIPRPAPVPPAIASAPIAPAQHVAEQVASYSPDVSAPAADVSGTLPAPEPQPWQRVTLAPGIELHYIPSDDARFNALVLRIIQAAHPLPDDSPENGEQEHNERKR